MQSKFTTPTVFGADIGSQSIVIVDAGSSDSRMALTINNSRQAISRWLKSLPPGCRIGMEATGRWHALLADLAYAAGHAVHVINPKWIANYARSLGQRGKTDLLDAHVIARFTARETDRLRLYTPPTPVQQKMRSLLTQRAAVVRHQSALRQSMNATVADLAGELKVKRAATQALKALDALTEGIEQALVTQVNTDPALALRCRLLRTIDGIGPVNSVAIAHRFSRTEFANSDSVIAAYGMDPRPNDSGQKTGKRILTKQGNPEDRRLIYLAAKSAARTRTFKPIYLALRHRGLASTEAYCIVARKLLRIAFAVWRSGVPFDAAKVGQVAA
jgi:transposase